MTDMKMLMMLFSFVGHCSGLAAGPDVQRNGSDSRRRRGRDSRQKCIRSFVPEIKIVVLNCGKLTVIFNNQVQPY